MDDHGIHVPLEQWAKDLVEHALDRHAAKCPLAKRVATLEVRFSSAVAFMVGSGLLGGLAGALVSLLGGGG